MQQTASGTRTGFWSSQTLRQHLSTIVDPPNPNKVKEACYRLSMGYEVYVTENFSSVGRKRQSVQQLKANQCFVIDPGHFALMITLETIRMPTDALGFLSIQTDVKFRGLVNISGFHVDPGSNGKIQFAVFNAGPSPVHLRQGDSIFRLWIADLDATDCIPNNQPLSPNIDVAFVNSISAPLESLQGLAKKVEDIDNQLSRFQTRLTTLISLIVVIPAIAFFAYTIGKDNSFLSNIITPPTRTEQTVPPSSGNRPPSLTPSTQTTTLPSKTANESTNATGTSNHDIPKSPALEIPINKPTVP